MAIPRLRSELDVRQRRDGSVEIRDPHLLQILTVDGKDYSVAAAFDGSLDADGVRKKLGGRTVSKQRVLSVAKEFEQLHLLDTPAARAAQPQKENVAPWSQLGAKRGLPVLPVSEPSGNWACHGCGSCCHHLAVELSPEEEKRIDRRLYRDILGDEEFWEEQFISPNEPAKKIMRQDADRNYACIFLAPNGLCYVHARQGMEAKPNACQMFPLMIVHVPRKAPRLGVRVNCQSMDKSFENGPKISSYTDHAVRIFKDLEMHKAPANVEMFGARISFGAFERITDELQAALKLEGLNKGLRRIDKQFLGQRVARSRHRYAMRVMRYVIEERTGGIPVEGGAYGESLVRVKRWKEALVSMAGKTPPPEVHPKIADFFRAQIGHVLWMCGPLNAPDAGYGLVALLLALEAAMHALGNRLDLNQANHAFDVFTAPLVETLEHFWPVLEGIDARYAKQVKEEMA